MTTKKPSSKQELIPIRILDREIPTETQKRVLTWCCQQDQITLEGLLRALPQLGLQRKPGPQYTTAERLLRTLEKKGHLAYSSKKGWTYNA